MYEWTHSPKAPHKIGSFLILANMAREFNTLTILKHLCAHVSFLMAWYCVPKKAFSSDLSMNYACMHLYVTDRSSRKEVAVGGADVVVVVVEGDFWV